jgi:type IV pilus assembly protein PilQ
MRKKTMLVLLLLSLISVLAAPVFSVEKAAEEKLTLNFYNAKLNFVLQTLSKKTGVKLVTNAEMGEMPVSAYLEDVRGEEAIDVILRANGLYREKISGSNVYAVKKAVETEQLVELQTETFFLDYAKAVSEEKSGKQGERGTIGGLGKLLESFLSPHGKMLVDMRTNSITVKDRTENLSQIREIIKKLDKCVPQVAIQAVLVELTTDGLKDLGISWNAEANFLGPSKDVSFPWDKDADLNIVGSRSTGGSGESGETSGPEFVMGRISFQTLTARLKMLESDGEANILANPRITTLNDSKAKIEISTDTAIAPIITETEEGGRVTTEYEYRKVGVILQVTPHVNEQGNITMEVEPTVSSASKSAVFTDAVDTYERTANTTVMTKSGDTIVIGGLLRTDTTENVEKVPFLGDILPFIFSNTSKKTRKTDLVIFLTPHIVTEKVTREEAEKERERMIDNKKEKTEIE